MVSLEEPSLKMVIKEDGVLNEEKWKNKIVQELQKILLDK